MISLAKFLYLVSLTVWIGSIVFFSFIGAPTLFKGLSHADAGKVVGMIFPKYYTLGIVAGFVALGTTLFLAIREGQWPVGKIILLLVMLTCVFYNQLVIHPRAHAFKEELAAATDPVEQEHLQMEFDHAHKVAVIYNGVVLLLGLLLLFLTARGLQL